MKVNFTPIPHPTDENVNLNLRRISDAFKSVAALLGGTSESASGLVSLGSFTAGTLAFVTPATARRVFARVGGYNATGGIVNLSMRVNKDTLSAYTCTVNGVGSVASAWPLTGTAIGSADSFAADIELTRIGAASGPAGYQWLASSRMNTSRNPSTVTTMDGGTRPVNDDLTSIQLDDGGTGLTYTCSVFAELG